MSETAADSAPPLLTVENLAVSFITPDQTTPVVRGVSFRLARGRELRVTYTVTY